MTNRSEPSNSSQLTRRRLIASAGVGAAGIGLAGAGGYLIGHESASASDGTGTVPFYGEHQAGIATAAQDRLHFAAFDLVSESRADLRELMQEWTAAAAEMTAGDLVGDVNHEQLAPPDDTGETVGLLPSRLTITFGFGPKLLERPRLGLRSKRPAALREIPPLPADELNPGESGGEICVQACSDDPQVAFHAVRNLARIGRGTVVMRWSQLGFGRTASTSRSQDTPRNLMGFKDGTANIRAEDTEAMKRFVWVGGEGPAWMRGGSYLVTRRIRMLMEIWDRSSLEDQEQTIGRDKYEGAPLGGSKEFDELNLDAETDGKPVIAADAHVRLASASANGGERILRRGYSFTDGIDESLGELDAGTLSLTLEQGEYTLLCPGGTKQFGTLTVSGDLEVENSPQIEAAVDEYRDYLEQNTTALVAATRPFVAAVEAGEVEEAKSLYPAARIPYERIEPVAESFGDLDPRIDARENDVPADEFAGFHRIEKALWVADSTAGMKPVAKQLLADVEELQQRVKTVELQAVQIANGANELLGEVSASKITGEEERYSHIDLVDFEANVEGSEAAFEAVEPLLSEDDPELAEEIEASFDDVYAALEPYRRADGFVLYTDLSKADTRKLAQEIDALAEELSQVPAQIVA